jgi:2-oxoglutarate ferredoxin oxidoreductase subunit gamma
MADIVLAGFGGQGVLTAGMILINAAAAQGKEVTWTSSYGAEMRGGTASCSVVISDEEIGNPYPTTLDVLIALNEPSYDKFIGEVRDGGVVIVNTSLIKGKEYPDNLKVFEIAATDKANAENNPRGTNIVTLGALMKATGMMSKEVFATELNAFFDKKGKNNPKNEKCFVIGYEEAKEV